MYRFRPAAFPDSRPLVAAAGAALAVATAGSWQLIEWQSLDTIGLAPAAVWALVTVATAGLAATLAADCFASRVELPVAVNDNPTRPPLSFRD